MDKSFAVSGDEMFQAGRYNDAIDYYQLFLETVDPGGVVYAECLCNIAKAFSQKGRYQKAIGFYKQSLDLFVKYYDNGHTIVKAVELQIDFCKSCLERGTTNTAKSETLCQAFKRLFESVDRSYMLKSWCNGIIQALSSNYKDFETMTHKEQQKLFKLVDNALVHDKQSVTIQNAQSFGSVFNPVAYAAARVVRGADYIEPPVKIIRKGRK